MLLLLSHGDNNIYEVDDRNNILRIIGQTEHPYDFLNPNDQTGGYHGPAYGIKIDFIKMNDGENIITKYTKLWQGIMTGNAVVDLANLARLSKNDALFDIKVNPNLATQGLFTPVYYHARITTIRYIGNNLFWQKYESNCRQFRYDRMA